MSFDRVGQSAVSNRWEGVVIGAGPAGSLAARQLALAGRDILIVDRSSFPRTKVCGACVNGHAISVLESVGLGDLMSQLGALPVDRFQLWIDGRHWTVRLPAGVAVSRMALDAELLRAAQLAGARFMGETSAAVGKPAGGYRRVRLSQGEAVIEIEARTVIAADGLGHPSLAGHPEFRERRTVDSRLGCGTRVEAVPDYFVDGVIYMCVSPSGYVGLVRQEDGSLNVAAALEPELVRRAGGLAALAGSVMHDAGGPSVPGLSNYHWQGTPLLTQRSRRVFGHRLFLVGDAAGYVEPLTGEGIAWALESAAAVAPLADRGIAAWSGELGLQWQAAYACVIERRQNICRWLARAAKYPSFFRAGMRVTEWFPSIADRLVKQLNAPTAIEKPRGAV